MSTPSLAMIPSGRKAGKVYSVLPTDGTGDFNFSRATTATRINKDGLIEKVGSNIPRIDYPLIDGVVSGCPSLLLEPQRSNLIPYSEEFDNAVWTNFRSSISPNTAISPDGSLKADKLVDTLDSGTHGIEDTILSLSLGSKYTYSIFVKSDEIKQVGLLLAAQGRIFDLENGTILDEFIAAPDASKIEDYGNGWYRCSITITLNAISAKTSVYLSKNNNITYQGDGTSGLYIYGAQLEAGSYATSYIPTQGSALTREAETASKSGLSSYINSSEGVLYFETKTLIETNVANRTISLTDGTSSNGIEFIYFNFLNAIRISIVSGGTLQFEFPTLTNQNQFKKIALVWNGIYFKCFVDGTQLGNTLTSASPIGLDTLNLGDEVNASPFYGKVKDLRVYNEALTDTELIALTQV